MIGIETKLFALPLNCTPRSVLDCVLSVHKSLILSLTQQKRMIVVAHACDPNSQEAEAGELLQCEDQHRPHSEFKANLNYKTDHVPKNNRRHLVLCCVLVIPAFRRLRQEDCREFKANLSYIVRLKKINKRKAGVTE